MQPNAEHSDLRRKVNRKSSSPTKRRAKERAALLAKRMREDELIRLMVDETLTQEERISGVSAYFDRKIAALRSRGAQ